MGKDLNVSNESHRNKIADDGIPAPGESNAEEVKFDMFGFVYGDTWQMKLLIVAFGACCGGLYWLSTIWTFLGFLSIFGAGFAIPILYAIFWVTGNMIRLPLDKLPCGTPAS